MIEDIKKSATTRMQKSVDSLRNDLKRIRTGRAHVSLLDSIMIDYYGTPTQLAQVANISAPDARTLSVSPWEKNLISAIEKAILTSDLGLNPATSSDVIRIPLPPLTEERRKELIKVVKAEGENGRIAIRNIRRDAIGDVKELLKEKEISEDEERKFQEQIQKITDKHVENIENVLKEKEKELLEI